MGYAYNWRKRKRLQRWCTETYRDTGRFKETCGTIQEKSILKRITKEEGKRWDSETCSGTKRDKKERQLWRRKK